MSRSTEELLVIVSQYTRPRTHPRSLGACQPGTRAAGPFVSFSGFTSDWGASFSLTHAAHAHTHTQKKQSGELKGGGGQWLVLVVLLGCSSDGSGNCLLHGSWGSSYFFFFFFFFFRFSLRSGGALLDDKKKTTKTKHAQL